MDSLTHLALGSAVGMAVMGRRSALWKAALAGALCNTLPDLDVFIDHGDPIRNMVLHRSASHALVYLTLLAPLPAGLIVLAKRERPHFKHWLLAVWLALITHPLVDTMTVYGTQLGLPFNGHPYSVGSIFIIDPLYTLPLLLGAGAALRLRGESGLNWNALGLVLSAVYLAWGVAAQQMVKAVAEVSLKAEGKTVQHLLITPTPFNSLLWRVLAITPQGYSEGFYSLLDEHHRVTFDNFPRGEALYDAWHDNEGVQRIAAFSHGFFKMSERGDGRIVVTDLRMGIEPNYTFSFVVGQRQGMQTQPATPVQVSSSGDIAAGLQWIWRRAQGELIPPPRQAQGAGASPM